MSTIHLRHIRSALEAGYNGLIDLDDYARRPEAERSAAFLQRALAAYALASQADIDTSTAAKAITDGYDDNGLDAVHYDTVEKFLYVVQSKWDSTGNTGPELSEVQKFLAGFRDLIDTKFDRFNAKLQAKQTTLLTALDDPQVRFRLLFVHSGQQSLSAHAQRCFDDLLSDLNDTSDVVSYQVLRQSDVHAIVVGQAEGSGISFDVALRDWGLSQDPHLAYYGQIEAEDIASWWTDYGTRLFTKNLRKFIGDSDVNNAMITTLRTDPTNFWYFNNGITVLCNSVTKKPIGGSDRRSGQFHCEGVSVINGAQTVGCIADAYTRDPDQVARARVMARFISLENCPPEYAAAVTRATNTQNRIERRDFVSLDPEQLRIQMELLLEGKQYALKTGDPDPVGEAGCSVVEATIALACALSDSALAVQAKREIGRLWENIDRAPYKLVFNGSVTGLYVWRCVEVMRIIDAELRRLQIRSTGRSRNVAVHGNRLILHLVMQRLPVRQFNQPQFDVEPVKDQCKAATRPVLKAVVEEAESRFPGSYLASLFKNATKCKVIATAVTRHK